MSKAHLPAIILGCLFLFGCLFVVAGARGISRGKFWYRRAWLTPVGDGWLFWSVTITSILSGVAMALSAIWFVTEYGITPPPQ